MASFFDRFFKTVQSVIFEGPPVRELDVHGSEGYLFGTIFHVFLRSSPGSCFEHMFDRFGSHLGSPLAPFGSQNGRHSLIQTTFGPAFLYKRNEHRAEARASFLLKMVLPPRRRAHF